MKKNKPDAEKTPADDPPADDPPADDPRENALAELRSLFYILVKRATPLLIDGSEAGYSTHMTAKERKRIFFLLNYEETQEWKEREKEYQRKQKKEKKKQESAASKKE